MFQSIAILILIILLLLALLKIKSLKQEIKMMAKESASEHQELSYLAEYNNKVKEIKTKKQNQILQIFTGQSKISNRDVAKALAVPSVTAFRYLDELEKAGKIVQNGKLGKTVFYTKIK